MASATRSKRVEGLTTANTRPRHQNTTFAVHQAPLANSKRRREDPERGVDIARSPKRARLMINLPSSPNPQHRSAKVDAPSNRSLSRTIQRATPASRPDAPHVAPSQTRQQQHQLHAQTPRQPSVLPNTAKGQRHAQSCNTETSRILNSAHQTFVGHGVDPESGKVRPGHGNIKAPEGRKLRSQEATRFKSDLAAYFPDYDEVIGNDPRPEHVLDKDTLILVVDLDRPHSSPQQGHAQPRTVLDETQRTAAGAIRSYGDNLFTDLCDSQEISFGFLESRNSTKADDSDDPLPDSYFEPTHKKAERAEKSLRNSERGRAQHEKEQIIRLLDGLQGHDWLRTMGVSGITESRKKEFEAPRKHFIRGCEAILEKFRRWNQEEKRRKLEKGRALIDAIRPGMGDHPDDEEDDGGFGTEMNGPDDGERVSLEGRDSEAGGDPPSDVDASIAKQLREEAMARSKVTATKAPQRSRRAPHAQPLPEPEPPVQTRFTSFFHKKYQRDAALSKSRRKGRTVLAWGQAIPDMPEEEFELPSDILDEKTLRSNERRRRRDKRGSK